MITVTGMNPSWKIYKRPCGECATIVTMKAHVEHIEDWGRWWKMTVWTGCCERCGELHQGELLEVMDEVWPKKLSRPSWKMSLGPKAIIAMYVLFWLLLALFAFCAITVVRVA